MRDVGEKYGAPVADYASLYQFSIDRPSDFWRAVWDFTGIIGERGDRVLEHPERMPGARFFPDARLNFAENLLRRRDESAGHRLSRRVGAPPDADVRASCMAAVVSFAGGLLNAGVEPGDRVAGFVPNLPESIVGALGSAADRRRVVLVLAGLRRPGRAGSIRSDRAEGPRVRRRLRLRRQDGTTASCASGDCARAAQRPARGRGAARRFTAGDCEPRSRRACGTSSWIPRSGHDVPFERFAVRSPALHPVLLGHDRRAEVHRARRRRHADSAPEGASAALRHPGRRPRVLLHHAADG